MLKQPITIIKMFNIHLNVLVLWYVALSVIPYKREFQQIFLIEILPDAIHHRYAYVFYGPQKVLVCNQIPGDRRIL